MKDKKQINLTGAEQIGEPDEVLSAAEVAKLEDPPNWVEDLNEDDHVRLVGVVRASSKDSSGFYFNTGPSERWVMKREVKRSRNIGAGLVSVMLTKKYANHIGIS